MKIHVKTMLIRMLKWIFLTVCAVLLVIVNILLFWYLRPNTVHRNALERSLQFERMCVIRSGRHNSMTDLTRWNGTYYLAFRAAGSHFAWGASKIVVMRSRDACKWEPVAELRIDEDIRDPKFGQIGSKLFLYVLKNVVWDAAPYATLYTFTANGTDWAPFSPVRLNTESDEWIFWRPKTRDHRIWYVPAYWKDLGRVVLFTSCNGVDWNTVSSIYQGERVNETAIEFLPDGRMLALMRVEGGSSYFGDRMASSMIAASAPPYTEWSRVRSRLSRLDGPCLFSYKNQIYVLGRYQPETDDFLLKCGSLLSKKRTSIYKLSEDTLVHIMDLPSSGDTAYGSVVLNNSEMIFAYYTSAVTHDFPWIMGMFGRASIQVCRADCSGLNVAGDE